MGKTDKDKPWVSNYPPLKEWLDKHQAVCMWQRAANDEPRDADRDWYPRAYIECWLVNGRPCIIVVHADKGGWEIYTTCNSNAVDATLMDAEDRLGVGKVKIDG